MSRKLQLPRMTIPWDLGSDYTVIKQIGVGSYGMVCEALHIPSGERVAIKQMTRIFDDKVDCKRLLREICLLRYFDHPNVVKIRDIITPTDLNNFNELFVVMEHAQSDLKKLVKSALHLEEDHIQLITYNILAGMKYIHSMNVLHRDLKPANILLNEDCDSKICDFGLARSLPEEEKPELFESTLQVPQEEEAKAEAKPQQQKTGRPGLSRSKPMGKQTMTVHVVTRWYRAPELILLEREYSKPIDVWSVGCIIAELCGMLQANVPTFVDRKPLFPGTSCFPLSPDHQTKVRRAGFPSSNTDQLNTIFEVIGTPSEENLEFITDEKALVYIQSFGLKQKISLETIYPNTHPALIELMEKMILFNPNNRISIDEAIRHPYFDDIRDLEKEKVADIPASFEFEMIEDITVEQLRYYFIQEISQYHN